MTQYKFIFNFQENFYNILIYRKKSCNISDITYRFHFTSRLLIEPKFLIDTILHRALKISITRLPPAASHTKLFIMCST